MTSASIQEQKPSVYKGFNWNFKYLERCLNDLCAVGGILVHTFPFPPISAQGLIQNTCEHVWALQKFWFAAVAKKWITVRFCFHRDVDSSSFWRFFTERRRTNEIPFVSFIWTLPPPPPTNVLIKLCRTLLWIKNDLLLQIATEIALLPDGHLLARTPELLDVHISVVCNYEMIMGANGLLDGCIRSAKESKEDGEFPHERCIGDSELKTKGKPCLLGEGARGPVGIGCIILTYCHYLFNCFVLCSSVAAADVGREQLWSAPRGALKQTGHIWSWRRLAWKSRSFFSSNFCGQNGKFWNNLVNWSEFNVQPSRWWTKQSSRSPRTAKCCGDSHQDDWATCVLCCSVAETPWSRSVSAVYAADSWWCCRMIKIKNAL